MGDETPAILQGGSGLGCGLCGIGVSPDWLPLRGAFHGCTVIAQWGEEGIGNRIETKAGLDASFLLAQVLGKAQQAGLQVGTMVRQILLAGLVVLLPVGLRAQGRGVMAPVSHAGAMAPRTVMSAPHAVPVRTMPGPRVVARGGTVRPRMGTPVARNTRGQVATRRRFENRFDSEDIARRRDCNSAPGLGFDAVHQAAICGSGTEGFRNGGIGSPFFFPFFDGGFSLPGSPAAVEDSSAADSVQPEATDTDARETARRHRAIQPVTEPAPTVETAGAAPNDNEEFVFVRRDGTVFFAVGYAWEKGTLRYVTSQGLRRTVTQDALDLDATREFNEQRGLSFRLPS